MKIYINLLLVLILWSSLFLMGWSVSGLAGWLLSILLLLRFVWFLIFLIWFWHFNNNISWWSYNFSFESFFWISSICNSTNETIGINNWVTALDYITITDFFTILVVCEFIVFNIETKLVWWIGLFIYIR